ncbi:aminopeptidase [Pseudomonas aeruginosa]|nr:aminopeptidase [Pseudomonas aeruginosa]PAZ20309.1 aminopeptidase [Pseudomonas aeruginosa]PCA07876.1 aminopeptidase [Pseudomonas aeruginosa]PCA13717.1 aminopeptidase [Pseudomonas aeruginosa]PCA19433.1 aminopeptidase [Pseudomonas aeruginosa]
MGAATAGGSPFGRFSAALLWVVAASPASHRRKGTARRGSATGMPIQRNPPGNSMDCEKNRTSCGMTVHSLTRKQEVSDKTRQANSANGAKSPFAEPAQGGSRKTIKRAPSMENSEAIPRSNKGRYQPVASNTLFRAKLADQARLLLTTS